MTGFREKAYNETLAIDTTYCAPNMNVESIHVGFSPEVENKDDNDYASVSIYKVSTTGGFTFAKVFLSLEEVDIIIQALQEAKEKILARKEE